MKQLGFSFSEGESKLLGLCEDSIPTLLALYSWAYSTSIKSDWDKNWLIPMGQVILLTDLLIY